MKNLIFLSVFSISLVLIPLSAQPSQTDTAFVPRPVFKNGEAQVVPEFGDPKSFIREELWVETDFDSDADGKPDRMHVFVTRPACTESGQLKLPAIYMPSPYYGLRLWSLLGISSSKYNWKVKHELGHLPKSRKHANLKTRTKRPFFSGSSDRTWVPRGYVMVYSSSPGTGLSDGAPTIGGENESKAPKAVIDWLCGRANGFKTRDGNEKVQAFWCSGKVGMTGSSYDGTLCIAAATTGVQGLEVIIPVAPVSSFYHYYRSNGLVRSPGGYQGEDMDVLYDLIHTAEPSRRKENNRRVRDSILFKNQDRLSGDFNAFWASRDYLNQMENMKCAMLMSHAFNDWNVMSEHSYRFYQAARKKGLTTKIYYHQGDHGGDPPFSMMNRWFTRYLHQIENGIENEKDAWITRERKEMPTPYDAYPDARASEVVLYPALSEQQNGTLSQRKNIKQESCSLIDDHRIKPEKLVQAKNEKHRLLFVTPVLEKDVRISGIPRVTVRLSSSKPAANLSAYLVSLPWEKEKGTEIYDNIINRAWADPQNHQSLSAGEPLQPGRFYEFSFDFMPDDQVIRKGQQIGLMIFSSDRDFTLCPKPGTVLTLDLQGTKISLPVIGGAEEFQKASRKP